MAVTMARALPGLEHRVGGLRGSPRCHTSPYTSQPGKASRQSSWEGLIGLTLWFGSHRICSDFSTRENPFTWGLTGCVQPFGAKGFWCVCDVCHCVAFSKSIGGLILF